MGDSNIRAVELGRGNRTASATSMQSSTSGHPARAMPDVDPQTIAGTRRVLLLGMWTAWTIVVLYVVYIAVLFAGGVAAGVPREPYLATAEILTSVGALIQVGLLALIHDCAPPRAKTLSLVATGWMLLMAGLTVSVHFVQLTVARRIDLAATPEFARLFGWEWPSLLYAIELLAWHLFLGLSLLFAASAFRGRGAQAAVRIGLRVSGSLCIIGLVGPALGNLNWRMIGVFGYGVVFPSVCVVLGLVFKRAASLLDATNGRGCAAASSGRQANERAGQGEGSSSDAQHR
jgi:hypothetical protein